LCKENDLIWCSEIVNFINEWRYYISNGNIIDKTWYDGHIYDDDYFNGKAPPAPELPKKLQQKLSEIKWCGVLDMGEILINNDPTLTLVEVCHPYGVGWCPSDNEEGYVQFIIDSDKYMQSMY
jgi:hypothetical protein